MDQELNPKIVDPLHRALETRKPEREYRIEDGKSERERDDPACEMADPGGFVIPAERQPPALEPRKRGREYGIEDGKAERERDDPACEMADPGGFAIRSWPHRPPFEP